MKAISRRSFAKNTAGALAAGLILPGAWLSVSRARPKGYFAAEFGIDDALCSRILAKALAKGGDFADLYFEHAITNYIILEDGNVNQAYSIIGLGVGIRTVKGDQVGYGFTQELKEKTMLTAASTAATIANSNPKQPAGQFVQLRTKNYYPLKTPYTAIPLESKLPIVQSVNDKCFALSPHIVKVTAGFYDVQKRIMVITSEGMKTEDLRPSNFLFTSVVAEKGGKYERAFWNLGGRKNFSYYSHAIADEIATTAVDRVSTLFDAVQPPAGEMPVVLGPGTTAILLHEAIGHGMEADFNRKNISTYSSMLNKKVAEPFVTIVDDATNLSLPGSINVDDEGTPGQKTVLVDKGILSSYMHDKISARHYKLEPTGNGRRQSYEHVVQPRMRNTYMLAGPASPEDVIKSVKKGIYVQDVSNGQVKIGEGDFSFFVSQGKMIENGKLTAPIKDINIMGNGPKMLRNITMLADDFEMSKGGAGACGKGGQSVPVGFGQPTCLVKSMTVGGTRS